MVLCIKGGGAMNTSIKKYNDLLIIGLILIIPAIHEFGHFLGYVIDGVEVTFTYAFTFSERQTMLGVLGGPLINIIISILAIALIYIDNKHKGLVLCQYFGHKKSNFFYAALLAINSH